MINLFDKYECEDAVKRINNLNIESQPLWGLMSVDQMLAHLNVAYDMAYTKIYKRPNGLKKFFIKLLAKKAVVGPKPYPKNGRTAPDFVISDQRDFESEKAKLIKYMRTTQALGRDYFEGKDSHSLGILSSKEWNTLFAKHLDHHLNQFNV